jgi:hypothetical protein
MTLLISCETDFNVNADWKEVTILYGLLDQNSETQFIKINKAFLGQDDALAMASISDSSNFNPDDLLVKIHKLKQSNFCSFDTLPDYRILSDTVVIKDEGLFPTDNNIIYTFSDSLFLSNDFTYLITVENITTGNLVSANTELVNGFSFKTNLTYNFGFYNENNGFSNKTLSWYKANNGEIYQLDLIFNFLEINVSDTINKSIVWSKPLVEYVGSDLMISSFEGEEFFNKLENSIDINNNVVRTFVDLNVRMTVGTEDLYTFINVNQPFSSIVQERPSFTNINNGIGLFSSRLTDVTYAIGLNDDTKLYIINNLNLNFQ